MTYTLRGIPADGVHNPPPPPPSLPLSSRCGFTPAEAAQCLPSLAQDCALALHVDSQCRRLAITSSLLQSWDLFITDTDLVSQQLAPLQGDSSSPSSSMLQLHSHTGLSLMDLRLRFLQLKHLNRQLGMLLPLVDLRCSHPLSLSSRLRDAVPLLFYDVKISFLHGVLNTATRRSLDQPPPEIKMDPLESVSGMACVPVCSCELPSLHLPSRTAIHCLLCSVLSGSLPDVGCSLTPAVCPTSQWR